MSLLRHAEKRASLALQEEHREGYCNFLRMDENLFQELLRLVSHTIQKKNTNMVEAISMLSSCDSNALHNCCLLETLPHMDT